MKRLAILAILTAGAAAVGGQAAAQAPAVCCVDPAMRGYMAAPPPPAYAQPYPGQGYPAQPYPAQPYPGQPYPGQPYPGAYAPPPGPPDGYPPRGLRGYVGVEYSEVGTAVDPDTANDEVWTAEAAISAPVGALDVQGDIKAARYEGPGGEYWVTSPSVHLFRRTAAGAFGGFAGISNRNGATLYGGGLEGQAYLGAATFYGSVGFGRLNNGTDYDVLAARVGARYFMTDNFRLDGSVGYVRQSDAGVREEAVVAAVGAEYQLGGLPASIRVGYQRANPDGALPTSDTFRVGVRWALTGDSLLERDRLGPTFDNISDNFMRN